MQFLHTFSHGPAMSGQLGINSAGKHDARKGEEGGNPCEWENFGVFPDCWRRSPGKPVLSDFVWARCSLGGSDYQHTIADSTREREWPSTKARDGGVGHLQ